MDDASVSTGKHIELRPQVPPIRVLHVIPSVSLRDGGTSRAILTTEAVLAAAQVRVTTATTDDDGPGRRHAGGSRPPSAGGVQRVYAPRRTEFYKASPEMAVWLWRNVTNFDVVHIHALFSFSSVAAGLIAAWRAVPYVVQPHGALASYGVTQRRPRLKRLSLKLLEAGILRRAMAVIFTSQAERDEALALGLRLNSLVIPLGVDPIEIGDPRPLISEHARVHGTRVLLFMSRLDPKKNIEGLLRAFADIDRQQLRAVLLVAGDGESDYVSELKKLAVSLDVTQDVIWLGHCEGRGKAAALAAADVFVLPSFSENFGVSAVEAMLAGLPVILGDGVAIAREVQDAGAGLSVQPKASQISQAIQCLLIADELRKEMGQRALAFATREYSPVVMARRLISLYQKTRADRVLSK